MNLINVRKLVIVLILFLHITTSYSKELLLITENQPPLNFIENGKLKGPAVEIIKKINHKLSLKSEIKLYPWARGYMMTLRDIDTALFSVARTEDRESSFKWVGPLAEKKHVLIGKADSNLIINNIEDAKNLTIGVLRRSSHESFLVARNFKNLVLISDLEKNLNMLLKDRIDLWYTSRSTAAAIVKKMNLEPSIIKEMIHVKDVQLYLAMNKDTDTSIVNLWQKSYEQLYKDGTVKNIFKKYNLELLYPKINF